MARHGVYVLGVAAVLLLGISTVSRSKGLKGREHQRASQIPSQFSPGERFAMKEALKGEPGPLRPAMPRYIGPSLLGPPRAAPLPPQRGHYWNWSSTTLPRPAAARVPVPRARAWGRHSCARPGFWGPGCSLPRLEPSLAFTVAPVALAVIQPTPCFASV